MKGQRKIFRVDTQNVDMRTGEIISSSMATTYVNRSSESFGMYRSTDGLDWAKELKNHLLFMLVLNEYSDSRTGIISLTPKKRKDICLFFGWSNKNSLSNVIKTVIDAGGITRCNGSYFDFMINPMCFYKGSTKDFKERYDNYQKYLRK